MVVMPAWFDQVTGIDFAPEKRLLAEIEAWAEQNGWGVSDGGTLPFDLRQRTDVLLERPAEQRRVRLAVLPKADSEGGSILVHSSDFVTVELVYRPRDGMWQVEAGNMVVEENLNARGFPWLFGRLFRS